MGLWHDMFGAGEWWWGLLFHLWFSKSNSQMQVVPDGWLRGLCLGQAGRKLEPRETQVVTRVAPHTMAAPGHDPHQTRWPLLKGLVGHSQSVPAGPTCQESVLVQMAFVTWFLEGEPLDGHL